MRFLVIVFFGVLDAQKFPDDFLFGTASSAYQIEGAWNVSGKGENIWDAFTHENFDRIADQSNADVSADSYHKPEEDVTLLKNLGVDFYVFSLSWSRILPAGFPNKINPEGLRHYNTLINLLLKSKIVPVVVLFEWDTPKPIEDLGGFSNPSVTEWYEDYARVAFENFGNRVKYWLTFNNPKEMCLRGYGRYEGAPGYNSSGILDYKCGHNVLKAHARVYRFYESIYRPIYHGKLSIGLGSNWYEPSTTSPEDVQSTKRALDFSLGWLADPIYHPLGFYPKTMVKQIESRLPQFDKDEEKLVKGSSDFFAVNYFGSELVANEEEDKQTKVISYKTDRRVKVLSGGNPPENSRGLGKILNHIKTTYQNPEIIVTGNGFPDADDLDDHGRVKHIEDNLATLLRSIREDEVKVVGYAVWSFLDSFEWEKGYTVKYGLHHVNFTCPSRKRTPKTSAKYYKDVATNRRLIITGKGGAMYLTPCMITILSITAFVVFY